MLSSIPIEIFLKIVRLACLPSNGPHVGRIHVNLTGVKVSHVCRAWRNIVVSDPQTWTNVYFYFQGPPCPVETRPKGILMDLYCQRSQNLPLHVKLDLQAHVSCLTGDDHSFLFSLFDDFARWRTAEIFISLGLRNLEWMNLYQKLRLGSPELETLEVTCDVYKNGGPCDIFPSFLWKHAPRLTRLAVKMEEMMVPRDDEDQVHAGMNVPRQTNGPINNWVFTIAIPYHQLTHLKLDTGRDSHLSWTEIASIFSAARQLISCSLRGIDKPYKSPSDFSRRVTLEHLKHLYLSGPYEKWDRAKANINLISALNQTLTAPSLQTLFIINHNEPYDQGGYMDFITRSRCQLSEIHFMLSLENPNSAFLEWVRLSSPTLRIISSNQIAMVGTGFANFLSEWDEQAGGFKNCPHLQKISIWNPWRLSLAKYPCVELVKMLRKRRCPPNGIQGTLASLSVPLTAGEALPRLRSLAKDPYCLSIQYCDAGSEVETLFERK